MAKLNIQRALQQGIAAHKENKLQEAERFYRVILNSQPTHPVANHNLGVLAVSGNKTNSALPLFKIALESNPKKEQFWLSYIDALIKENQFENAKQVIEQGKKNGVAGEKLTTLEAQLAAKTKPKNANSISPSLQQLSNLLRYYQNGRYGDAEKLAVSITQEFPNHPFSWKILGALLGQTGRKAEALKANQKAVELAPQEAATHHNLGITQQELGRLGEAEASLRQSIALKPNFAEAHYNLGITLKTLGRLEEAEASYRQAMGFKPDYAEAHNGLGITLKALGRLEEAEASYRQAIAFKPDYTKAHYNLGIMLQELPRSEEAEASYRQAIALNPDFAEAHYNLGITLSAMGRLEEAEAKYRHAIALKPDYAEAHNNLGITLKALGRLDEAIDCYEHAIKITPNSAVAESNLVACLTSYNPQKVVSHPIAKVNQEIRKIGMQVADKTIISNDLVIKLCSKFLSVIKNYNFEIETKLSQIYRRNSVDLNCKRHKIIFNQHNVIAKFCFGCYKVQVEPKTILELIKLFIVFDQLKLEENNTRKCMIELRPEIPGFYKGLVYCSGLDEANKVKEIIDVAIKEHIGSGLSSKIKRGCSEYPNSFPDYQEINNSGPQLMNYNEGWKTIEENHDRKNPIKVTNNLRPSLSGLNLEDVLIIRKWIDYARGIGDPNTYLLDENVVQYPDVYNQARERLDKYQFIC